METFCLPPPVSGQYISLLLDQEAAFCSALMDPQSCKSSAGIFVFKYSAERWHWVNPRHNLCPLRMHLLFGLLFCWKIPALAVPSSQLFKWRQCGQILWFSMFTVPLSISAAAVISQDAEATDLWFATIDVQWFSILCFSKKRYNLFARKFASHVTSLLARRGAAALDEKWVFLILPRMSVFLTLYIVGINLY